MKAAVFDRFGDPAEVLQVRDVPMPEPGRGQVRVRMLASPMNPSDLMYVRGQYGRRPTLPATPGFEGAGVVEAAGPGLLRRLRGLSPGRRVAVLNSGGGNWQEYVVVGARQAVPVPAELSDEQVATFFVNPASALAMVRHVLRVPPGAWLLQTAAGGALGRMIIRLGRRDGFRTINVVRRRQAAQELRAAGADAVIASDEQSIENKVSEITGGAGVRYALDAVGGESGAAVVRCLGDNGRLLVYGTLCGEPSSFDPRHLMVRNASVEGFWLSNWASRQGVLTMLKVFRDIGGLLKEGTLSSDVAASVPLEEIGAAVRRVETPGRGGKVLLRIAKA